SFVLTESSLAVASIPTTTVSGTLTNPDQATTTVPDVEPTGSLASAALSAAPLPTGLPARIYPQVQLPSDADLTGFTIISILFNQELNWPFVVEDQVSSSQIFAFIPILIANAVGIDTSKVKTWALQVYVPTTYRDPSDAIELGTMWLGYIPTDLVDTLAAEIKAKQSAFYTGVASTVARDLAGRVNSGFSLRSVADPKADPGNPGSGSGSNASVNSASSNDGKARQDAIIGVVSALGAIALLVLVFLIYRSIKRRRALAHRRLSDPPDMDIAGARPEGREFDRDSMGAPRRRSFYYAEDSLRGFQEREEYAATNAAAGMSAQPGMSQRRNVMPAAISAPILRESSMNW
ncbi:hypothetical protein BDQ12DRAFT_604835, partial [Crucibulum laeve]